MASETTSTSYMLDLDSLGVESAMSMIFAHSIKMSASDVFIMTNESYVAVQVRHLGIVRPIGIMGLDPGRRLMQHIKANSGMDVAERHHPAEGRWFFETEDDGLVDLRITTVPTLYGEDFGIRLLVRKSQLFDIEHLGMLPDQYQKYRAMLEGAGGLILITGPSGSGKTATLYAALSYLNDGSRKINTIEDPIEFALDGLRQSQISQAYGLTFSDMLRSLLRQAPDVIMVGEIRDKETAEIAVRAANSGHMVFSTLHAPVAAGAVHSMLSLGTHPHFLSTSLRGIIAQRLVRTLCPQCRLEFDISNSPNTFDEIKSWLGPDEGRKFYGAGQCDACNSTGYVGQSGVFEIMEVSSEVRYLIANAALVTEIRAKAVEQGMLDFRKAALLKVAKGLTTTEEIFRVIPPEHLLVED